MVDKSTLDELIKALSADVAAHNKLLEDAVLQVESLEQVLQQVTYTDMRSPQQRFIDTMKKIQKPQL